MAWRLDQDRRVSTARRALRRALHPVYRWLETDVHPLRYVFLEITRRCTLACRHCGSDCGRAPAPNELSEAEWLGVLDQLVTDFDPRQLVVVLTGGEPLCHPSLEALLEGLRGRGLAWGLVTNGWALDAAAVDRLLAHGLGSVTVSLDGLAPSHDWLRGRLGSFDRAVAGIAALVRARPRFLDVVTCVHPGNLHELPAVERLLLGLGVPAWRLFPIFPRGRAAAQDGLRLSPPEYQALLHFIAAARRRSPALSVDLSCEGWLPAAQDRAVRDEPYFCRAGICVASVLCDGGIGACPSIDRALVQGNVRQSRIRDVWEQRFVPYRDRRWLQQGRCAGCGHFGRCQGNSLHLVDAGHPGLRVCPLDLLG
jgi:radical SAM protein with 4Fe4S-binding SPASM domain